MKKTIYMPIDISAKEEGFIQEFEGKPTFDRNEAIEEAESIWNHLTDREQKKRHIYVGVFTVEAEEGKTAKEIYDAALDEDTWPADHNAIEIR